MGKGNKKKSKKQALNKNTANSRELKVCFG